MLRHARKYLRNLDIIEPLQGMCIRNISHAVTNITVIPWTIFDQKRYVTDHPQVVLTVKMAGKNTHQSQLHSDTSYSSSSDADSCTKRAKHQVTVALFEKWQ